MYPRLNINTDPWICFLYSWIIQTLLKEIYTSISRIPLFRYKSNTAFMGLSYMARCCNFGDRKKRKYFLKHIICGIR